MGSTSFWVFKLCSNFTYSTTIILFGIFHFLRLRSRDVKPTRQKCLNQEAVSYFVILTALTFRLFVLCTNEVIFPSIWNQQTCIYYSMVVIELNIIVKFWTHLFVVLRSQVAEIDNGTKSIWFKLVCTFCC